MQRLRFVIAASLAALVLTGLGPAGAGPRAASNINDLHDDYVGEYHSTDGSNDSGIVILHVDSKQGTTFKGEIAYNEVAAVEAGIAGPPAITVDGTVSTKGKITMKGTIPTKQGNFKFNLKGTLSDNGQLIVAAYSIKKGKQTVLKAICYLQED